MSTDVTNNKIRASSPSAPAIPPLPSTHEIMINNKQSSAERTGSVAKIISQFQEAAIKSTTTVIIIYHNFYKYIIVNNTIYKHIINQRILALRSNS